MADIKLVIKISEEDYKLIKSYGKGSTNYRISLNLYDAVKNGTPLPKNHGRQIEYVDLTEVVVADKDTHILYVYYSIGNQGYLCPYYSKNGKLCKYEDGKIIEVEKAD